MLNKNYKRSFWGIFKRNGLKNGLVVLLSPIIFIMIGIAIMVDNPWDLNIVLRILISALMWGIALALIFYLNHITKVPNYDYEEDDK